MLHSPPLPPPRLAAAALLLLLLAFASAQLDHSAVADDAQLGTLVEDQLREGALNESPNFNRRRRPSRWRSRSPEVVGPTDSSTTPSQPSVDVVDSQEFGSSSPPGRPYRSRTRTTQRSSRNRTSNYAPVFRRPQHRYALRGNHEQSSSTASRVTFPLTFSSTTASILTQAATEGSEHTSNFKEILTSATAEPIVGRNNPSEKSPFSEDFNNRLTESPLSIDLSVFDRPPALTEIGQEDVAKSTRRWTLSSTATASGFDSRRTSPRAAGIRSLFGRRFKHRSTLQPEQYMSPSTSQFSTTAETPLTRTVQLDGHTRAARDYEVLETTTPQVVARTPRGRRRLVSVSRRILPIDASTEATLSPRGDEGQDQRTIVRVQKRRRPVTIDTITVSAVSTTEVRDSLRKTKVYKRRRPVPTNAVTTEPSLLEDEASGNQRGYRRVRPSSSQQESTNQQGSTTNSGSYKPSTQSSSKSEETFVGGRRKHVGKVRVRGRRPLLSDSETGVGSSEKAVEGEGPGTVLTTTVETPQRTTSVVPEVPKPHAPPSMSTTVEATTSRRVFSRSRRPYFGIRRAVTPSVTPFVQAEPTSPTTPSSLQEESSTAGSLTPYTPTERGDTITEGTTVERIDMPTTSSSNQSTTQITGDTVSENEVGQSKKFTPKFGGAKGRHPGRRVGLGSKYSKEQRKTTPEPNRIGLTSGRTKASTVSTTSERPTGNISDRFVKSRTLNSLRNRKPISLLRRNNVSNITEELTATNKSLDEHTVENESPVASDGGSASFLNMSVVDNNTTTDSPAPSTIKGKDRLKKIKRPLTVTKIRGPPKLPVLKKISSNLTEDEKAETSTISEKGTRLKGRKPTSLDKLLKMRRPLPTLLRKSQNEFVPPASENVERSSNSETTIAISTLPTSADTTPGQTTADEIETTTAAAATSSLQPNIDDGAPNGIRKLPKGFKPSRFRPTIGEPRKIGIKDTPRQGVRGRPRLTPSSAVKKGVNDAQATAPLKTGLFGNRRPFSGLKPSLLKSTGRFNKKQTDYADENTEIPTTSVKEATEAYNASLKVADKVIKGFGVNTASTVEDEEVQNVTTDRPTITTEETATFQAKNDSLGNEVGETLDSLVDPTLSPLEEGSTTTRKSFLFPRARGRGNDKSSKLKSLQKLLSVLRQKSNGGVASTTVKFDTETAHPTPEVPSELTSDSASDLQNTVSQTEIPILGGNTVSYGDDLKTTDTTKESTFTTVIETTVVPVGREGNVSRLGITENYGNTFLQPSMTTETAAFSVPEKSGSEDNTTMVTKILEAETETTFAETTYPQTTTESGGRLVLKGSESLDGENSGMKCSSMSGESMTTNEHLSSLQPGKKAKDNASSLCGENVRTDTTELPLSVTKRPGEVPATLESSTEVLDQSTTMVYTETATVTEPSLTFQMATLLPELTVPEGWTEPTSTETTEGSAPGSQNQRFSVTDIVLHNLTKAISQLANEIDSVYTDINVTSEFMPALTTDLPNITEQATYTNVELNTAIPPGIENAVLTTETPIATDTANAETVPQQFSTTSETTTTEVNTEDPGTTVENTYSAVVKVTELPTATTAVLEEVTVPPADAVNAETVPQQYHTTSETTTHASTEDAATAIAATVQNIYSAVVKETELPTATTAVPEETKVPSGVDLEQSTTSIQGRNVFTESVHTDKSLATTDVPDMWIGVTSGSVTEVYETMVTQTDSLDSEATEGNLSDKSSLPTTSPITEENGRNVTKFVNGSLADLSDDQSEFDSSFSRGRTSIVPTVDEFLTADTTVVPDLSTTALVIEVQGDDRGYSQFSTIDDVVTYDNGVSSVMPESDASNDVSNSYTVKGDKGALLGLASGEEQENLTIESSANNGTTEATVYQTQQPVTNEAVTETVTESETLEPSTPKNSDVNDTAVSDSNSILGYEMATDPDTVAAEVTEEGLSSTTVQTIKPEENDLKANEVNFDDSLYLPTTQVNEATSPTQRLEPTNTESSVSTTTEPNPYVSASSINSAEEMLTYSSLPDTASTANAFPEDKNTVSPGDITSPAVSDNTVTDSTSTEPGSHLPVNTTYLTYFADEITTESTSVAEDSENYASSGPFHIQTVTSFNSLLGERAHFHKETTLSPFAEPLITSMDNEDDRNEGPSAWHSSFAESESTMADHDTSFSPTVTAAFPMTSETVAGVTDVTSAQFSNTKQDSREDDDVVKYRDIERNSIYTDVSTPTFADSVQSTTPLSASNYTEQWTERIENNDTVNQDDIVTGITDASFIYTDTTKSPSPDSEGNNHQLLTTGAATQAQTENGLATYWTESVESSATDTLLTREVEPLTSDTKDITESSFSDSSTNYASPDDESLHGDGNGRFPALDINTLAPS